MERSFRTNQVVPFLKTLKNSYFFAIQQMAICGDPDFIGISNGKFIGLELKIDNKKPRKLQEFKLSEITKCGGIAIVAFPQNWSEVKKLLIKIDNNKGNK